MTLAQVSRCLPRFIRRCTSSSPWIHIYCLRACISLSKPDNANHELLIAIVHPLWMRTWCSISCFTSMRKIIVFYTDELSKQGNSGVTNQGYFLLRTPKQSTYYSPSAYLLNFISGVAPDRLELPTNSV